MIPITVNIINNKKLCLNNIIYRIRARTFLVALLLTAFYCSMVRDAW